MHSRVLQHCFSFILKWGIVKENRNNSVNKSEVILEEYYVSYSAALEMCGLEKLSTRREKRQLSFSLKCIKNEFTKAMFPENENKRETFHVNFARTEKYKRSAIPQCQRVLNAYFSNKYILHSDMQHNTNLDLVLTLILWMMII